MSGFGTARQIAAAQYFSRFWSEADIQRAALTESPIDPVFRPDGVVLTISAGKDGNCGWSTPGSDAAKVVLLGEVLKLRWRGPTPPLRVTA
jgi:hypothetical protein